MHHSAANKALADYGKFTNVLCKDTMRRALAAVIGLDGTHTYESLADALDIEERTLKGYALGECLPGLPVFLKMCALLGDDFAALFFGEQA